MENTKKKRNGFASSIGFILAAAGSAVGLGNLWSFPYKTSIYGGAAFVLVYILSVIVIGSIVMIGEIYLGKRAMANPVSSYAKANKNLGWLGLFAIIIPFFIICYYSVLGGYTVKYAMNSFAGNAGIIESFTGNVGEVILYTAIFMLLALIVVMAGVKGGIEKASKVLMPALFIILVAMVIYCLCLGTGVKDGLDFYILKISFKALGFKGVLGAMGQAFYSLSLGMGIMVSYGSYTGKEIKVGKSAILICVFDTLVALLAGFAIFPAVYHYKATFGSEVATSGLMLLFSSLPLVFDSLGVMGQIVSFFFFGMVVIAALTSVISLLEVVTQFVIQKFKIHRKKAILYVALICFAISIPVSISLGLLLNGKDSMLICGQDWLDFFDLVTNTVLMPVCAFGSCLAIGWFIDKKFTFNPFKTYESLSEDGFNIGKFGKFFAVMIKYVTPILIAVVEIFGIIDLISPNGTFDKNGLGIVLTAYGLLGVAIAVYFIFLKGKNNGCNADEIDIAVAQTTVKEEFSEE
ncbi:MAG: sodium-dependent transporter [Clostridia bacterium]|nr:sodium-dependent transporter [Clostridia bacterium]